MPSTKIYSIGLGTSTVIDVGERLDHLTIKTCGDHPISASLGEQKRRDKASSLLVSGSNEWLVPLRIDHRKWYHLQ